MGKEEVAYRNKIAAGLGLDPRDALDEALVCFGFLCLFPCRQVPDLDDTVGARGRQAVSVLEVLGEAVYAVLVADTDLSDKRRRKHALHLGRLQRTGVFAGPLEGVQRRVVVALLVLRRRRGSI